jgi:hypothetical protein
VRTRGCRAEEWRTRLRVTLLRLRRCRERKDRGAVNGVEGSKQKAGWVGGAGATRGGGVGGFGRPA